MGLLGKRNDYGADALAAESLGDNPLRALQRWVMDAELDGMYEPSAFVLATVGENGRPTSRTVLLRHIDDRGLQFFTNYESRKAQALAATEYASATFGWYAMQRQVQVEGRVLKLSDAESDAYFASRPRASQIGAWASRQSQPVDSREALEALVAEAEARFAALDQDGNRLPIPRPPYWGGYLIEPLRIEFWKGRSSRLHDRIEFTRAAAGESWMVRLLQP